MNSNRPSEPTTMSLSLFGLISNFLISGTAMTPTEWAISSPNERLIARPGTASVASQTRSGPNGSTFSIWKLHLRWPGTASVASQTRSGPNERIWISGDFIQIISTVAKNIELLILASFSVYFGNVAPTQLQLPAKMQWTYSQAWQCWKFQESSCARWSKHLSICLKVGRAHFALSYWILSLATRFELLEMLDRCGIHKLKSGKDWGSNWPITLLLGQHDFSKFKRTPETGDVSFKGANTSSQFYPSLRKASLHPQYAISHHKPVCKTLSSHVISTEQCLRTKCVSSDTLPFQLRLITVSLIRRTLEVLCFLHSGCC